jgi:hypothetical protein
MVTLFKTHKGSHSWYALCLIDQESIKDVDPKIKHNYQDRLFGVNKDGTIDFIDGEDSKEIGHVKAGLKPKDLPNFKKVMAEIFCRCQYDYIKERPMSYDEWDELRKRGEIDMEEEAEEMKITKQAVQEVQHICYALTDIFTAFGIQDVKFRMSGIELGNFIEWGSKLPNICLCGSAKYRGIKENNKTICIAMSSGGYQLLFQDKTPTEVKRFNILQKQIFGSVMFGKMNDILSSLVDFDVKGESLKMSDSVEGLTVEDVESKGIIVNVDIEFGESAKPEHLWMFFPSALFELDDRDRY